MARSAVLAIAAKELQENVHSRRFQIALALSALLMVTSVVAHSVSYREDLAAWQQQQQNRQQAGEVQRFNPAAGDPVGGEVAEVLSRPHALSVFVSGPGDAAAREAAGSGPGPGQGSTGSGGASPTDQRFPVLDLGFVAVVVVSLMAVLFAHDAVSGERERGTLKLMLANPVPRDAVLLGKYLGGMASVLLPFGLSLVLALAVFPFTGVPLSAAEWGRLGLIVLLVLPLASAFYLLGLVVSSLTRRSGTSLLALLLVWLLLVFGAGNVAGAVAKATAGVTGDAEVLREFQAINEEQQLAAADVQDRMFALGAQARANGSAAAVQSQIQLLNQELSQVFSDAEDERDAVLEAARRELDGQLQAAETLAAASPSEAFRNVATALARTDHWSFKHARETAEAYAREAERAREAWAEEHNQSTGPVRFFVAAGPDGGDGPAVNAGPDEGFEAPEFTYRPEEASAQLASGRGVRDLGVLLAYNLTAFAAAWVAFRRYDVR